MKTADQIAAAMLAGMEGMEGVACGPWNGLPGKLGHYTGQELAVAEHLSRCDPQSIRALIEDRAMWKARAEMAGGSAAKTKDLDILGLLRLGQELLAEEPDTGMAALCKRAADEIERLRRELNDRDMWKARVGSLMEKNTCP